MGMFDDILDKVGEPYKGGKGFEYGTHKVKIGFVQSVQKKVTSNDNASVIEVGVYNPDNQDQTATATLYFHTEKGAKMSVTKVLGILVHNVGEEKKDKVRELGKKLFGDITDLTKARDIAAKLMNDKMIDKEAYLFVDPQGKYKTSAYGDIWHYEYEAPDADERTDKLADENRTAADELGGTKLEGDDLKEATEDFDDL